jgi:Helicase conserved C-terminal domain/SNF2-related domain
MSIISRRKLWSFFEALYSQELNENSAKATTPEWLKTPLLLHQQSALAAALRLETAKTNGLTVDAIAGESVGGKLYTSYGILGDRVGSGKSLTALSLVKMPAPSPLYNEYIVRGNSILGDGRDVGLLRVKDQTTVATGLKLKPLNTSLFIIPHALIGQWEMYVANDTTLKCCFVKKRKDAESPTLLETIEQYDALFISSTMWNSFRTTHHPRNILWKRVFIDEADSISITTDWDDINGLFYWFISASWLNLVFAGGAYFNVLSAYTPPDETPPYVIERVKKLQNNHYLQIPGCRHVNIVRRMCGISANHSTVAINAAVSQSARLIVHSSETYIQTSFTMPTTTTRKIICATPTNIRVLDSFISQEMMERLNAGDVTGALESLGMNSYTETDIANAVTASIQKELHNAKVTYEYKKTLEYSTDSLKQKAIEAQEQKIASIESRISAIQERLKRAKEQTCPICYCDLTSPSVTPCCQQLFCFPCLCESLKRVASCPLCRARIDDIKEIKVLGDNPAQAQPQEVPKTNQLLNKNDSFVKFMKENPTARVLMFSSYDASFTKLEDSLDEANIKHSILNGSQARIAKLLREFKAGKYNVLFLNARNMGAGLNIECASHVMLFHRMSSELENQIIGRANRLGRTASLEVVYLIHENELSAH